jgi:IS30 family transposase
MTFDNGKEFAGFKVLEGSLSMQSYFAHAYSSYERGTNENTNGLLRQFFSKGTDFHQFNTRQLDKVRNLLNNRPGI